MAEHERTTNGDTRHRCRTCGKPIREDANAFPFCSSRCRNVDMGKWIDEEYRISREIKESDIETVD